MNEGKPQSKPSYEGKANASTGSGSVPPPVGQHRRIVRQEKLNRKEALYTVASLPPPGSSFNEKMLGIAAQQVLELVFSAATAMGARHQKLISKVFAIAFGSGLGVAAHRLGAPPHAWTDIVLAGLMTAAFAELTNAAIKWLVYSKETRKADAANGLSTAGSISLKVISRK